MPGHHLQLAQWAYLADRLSTYQTSVGSVSGNTEGWALYAERLMDELGYLTLPGARLGYLDAQQMRAIRVVIDIGMHLGLRVPADSPLHAGETWTPEVARAFFGAHSGRSAAFVDSEIVRYLGWPGQAISYKLGERAWLAGRDAAKAAQGRRLRPQGVARGGAVAGQPRPGRPDRRAGPPLTRQGSGRAREPPGGSEEVAGDLVPAADRHRAHPGPAVHDEVRHARAAAATGRCS